MKIIYLLLIEVKIICNFIDYIYIALYVFLLINLHFPFTDYLSVLCLSNVNIIAMKLKDFIKFLANHGNCFCTLVHFVVKMSTTISSIYRNIIDVNNSFQ